MIKRRHKNDDESFDPNRTALRYWPTLFAEFERAINRERVLSGIARAKAEGAVLGRHSLEDSNADKFAAVKAALAEKQGIRRIARELQTGVAAIADGITGSDL
jgi:DNA invertase Pin-like site-specific DNA recombinase